MNRVVDRYIMSDCHEKFQLMSICEDDSEILVTGLYITYMLGGWNRGYIIHGLNARQMKFW